MTRTLSRKASSFFTYVGVSGADESGPGNERIDASKKYSPFIDVESKEDANGNCATYVVLGNNVKVQNNVSLYTGVICDDDVFLGPSCVFTNILNPRSHVVRKGQYETTHVGKGASIGANATIVCGHNIGKYAFIGAGAVVTKNIPDYALVVGNPSKQIGWMSEYGHRLIFNLDGEAKCEESGDRYSLVKGVVKKE